MIRRVRSARRVTVDAERDPKYRRVLLKLSGEALMGDQGYGLDPEIDRAHRRRGEERCTRSASQVCLVIGGGNIFRGLSGAAAGMERATGRLHGHAGDRHQRAGDAERARAAAACTTRVQSAIPMQAVCEPYIRRRAIRHLEKGRVVIFAAGTGNPVFHDRHRGGAARLRDGVRGAAQGDQGRWRLQRRSEQGRRRRSATSGSAISRCCRATCR